jgi:hypothetical protein
MDIMPRIGHHSGHGRTSSFIWGQPERFSGQTNPREECPAYKLRRSTQRATYAIGSSRCGGRVWSRAPTSVIYYSSSTRLKSQPSV